MSAYHNYRQVTLCARTYKGTEARATRGQRIKERLEVMFPAEMALLKRKAAAITCPTCSQCGQKVNHVPTM